MRLKIVNWKKYHARPQLKSMPWFKLHNRIVYERKLYGCVPSQKWFWICLLSFAAQENSDEIEIDVPWASHETGVPENEILQAIEHFEKSGMVTKICNSDVTDTLQERNGHERIRVIDKRREEKIREEKKEEYVDDSPPTSQKFSDWDLESAKILKEKIINFNPDAATRVKKIKPEKWADQFRLMRETDKIDMVRITEVIDWLFSGKCFYASNVQAAKKLREEWGRITGYMNNKTTNNQTKKESMNDVIQRAREKLIQDGYGS